MKRPDAQQWLAATAAAVTITLTATAFWLSYEHLHDVAATNGLQGSAARAWAWPATVDMFIVVGELLVLRASLAHRVDPWAVGLTVVGSGGSIALNVAGVGAHADPLEYIVAAVPPVAALLAFGALLRQVHEALTRRTAPVPVAVPERVPAAVPAVVTERVPQPVPVAVPVADAPPYPQLPPAVPATPPKSVPARGRVAKPAAVPDAALIKRARRTFATDLQAGRTPSIRALRAALNIGQDRAKTVQARLTEETP